LVFIITNKEAEITKYIIDCGAVSNVLAISLVDGIAEAIRVVVSNFEAIRAAVSNVEAGKNDLAVLMTILELEPLWGKWVSKQCDDGDSRHPQTS